MNFFFVFSSFFSLFICFYFFERRNKNKGKNQNPQSSFSHSQSIPILFSPTTLIVCRRLKSFYFSRHLTKISIANSKNVYDCVQKTNSVMKYFLSLNTYLLFLSLSSSFSISHFICNKIFVRQ